jgi:hypothetical protein
MTVRAEGVVHDPAAAPAQRPARCAATEITRVTVQSSSRMAPTAGTWTRWSGSWSRQQNRRGGLAPKTVRNVHGVLHAALRDAVRWGYLPRNIAAGADLPKSVTPEVHVWNPEQLRAFLEHVRRDSLHAACCCSPLTGCGVARSPGCAGSTWTWGRPGVAATAAGGRQPRGRRL